MNYVSSVTGSSAYQVVSAADLAQSTSAAAFASWPESVQARFIEVNGSGTPPAVVIGPSGGAQILASLSSDGSAVTQSPLPADFATLPSNLAPSTFESWSTDLQLYYVRTHLAAGATGVSIGPSATAITAALDPDGDGVVVSGGAALDAGYAAALSDPQYAPSGIHAPTDFLSWPPDVQYAYYQTYRDGTLKLDFTNGQGSGVPLQLAFNGVTYAVLATPAQLAAVGTDPAALLASPGGAGAPSPATFAGWSREMQRDYVITHAATNGQGGIAYPATVVLGGSLVATVAADGAEVDTLANVPGFASALAGATPPTLESFTAWPEAAQLAYARAKLLSPTQTLRLFSAAAGGQTDPSFLTIARDGTSASGFTLTPTLGSPAQTADLALLHLLSPTGLQTYLAKNGTGTPASVVLGTPGNRFLVTAAATASAPAVAIQSLPDAALGSPTVVSQTDFLGWTQEVQTYVFGRNAVGTPPAMLLGSGTGQVVIWANENPADNGYTLAAVPSGFAASPAAVAARAFNGWTAAEQALYFALNASGTPPTLVIGAGSTLVSPYADPNRSDFAVRGLPGNFAQNGLTAADVLAWTPEQQSLYLTLNGTGTPPTLTLRSSLAANAGTLTISRDAANPYALDFSVAFGNPPQPSDIALFSAMTPDQLQNFVANNGTGSPKAVVIGSTLLSGYADPTKTGIDKETLPAAFTLPSSTLSAAVFASWSPEVQARYFAFNAAGTPAALLVGPVPTQVLVTASTSPANLGVTSQPYPATQSPSTITATTFQSWTPEVQAQYFIQQAAGTPPTLLIGPGSGSTLVSPYADPSRSGLAVQPLPPGFDKSPATTVHGGILASDFLAWTPEQQSFYVMRYGIGPTPTLTLRSSPDLQAGSLTVSPNSANPYALAFGVALGNPPQQSDVGMLSALTPDQLQNFVANNGTGSPKALVIGSTLVSAYADTTETGADIEPLPTGFTVAPSGVTPNTFASWTTEVQARYFALHATGTPAALLVGPSGTSATRLLVTASTSPAQLGVTWEPYPVQADDPFVGQVGTTTFQSWTPGVQAYYFAQHSAGTPSMMLPNTATLVTAAPSGSGFVLANAASSAALQAYLVQAGIGSPRAVVIGNTLVSGQADTTKSGLHIEVLPATFAMDPAFLPPATFGAWSDEVKARYFQLHASGSPPALAVGPGSRNRVLVTGSADPAVLGVKQQSLPDSADPLSLGKVDGAMMQGWTPEVQAWFFSQAATGTPPMLALKSGTLVTAAPGALGAGAVLSYEALPSKSDNPPSGVVYADVASWTVNVQTYYLSKYGSGTPRSVVIGNPKYLLSQPFFSSTSGLVLQPLPTGFNNAPSKVAATAFATWTREQQAAYLAQHNGSATFSDGVTIATADLSAPLAIPYYDMTGGASGTGSTVNADAASTLFPVYDGVTATMSPKPDGFDLAPDQLPPATWGTWNSAFQLEYIHKNASRGTTVAAQTITDASGVAHTLPAATYLTIGSSVATGANPQLDVFIGGPQSPGGYGTKVYTVQTLQKQDIAKMSLQDQATLSAIGSFNTAQTGVASALGLIPNGTAASGVQDAINQMYDVLKSAEARITWPAGPPIVSTYAGLDGMARTYANLPAALPVDGQMSATDKAVFIGEIENIRKELATSAIFSPNDVNTQITTIMTRYARANAFAYGCGTAAVSVMTIKSQSDGTIYHGLPNADGTAVSFGAFSIGEPSLSNRVNGAISSTDQYIQQVQNKTAIAGSRQTDIAFDYSSGVEPSITLAGERYSIVNVAIKWSDNISSLDNNTSIKQSFTTFMTQENTLLQLSNKSLALAAPNSRITQQNLDLPNLIYLFQLYANLAGEAIIRADTEEVTQTNNLLTMYSVMQQIINTTIQNISPDDAKNNNPVGIAADSATDATAASQWAAAKKIFYSVRTQYRNPIELLKNLPPRPTVDVTASFDSTDWTTYGTKLSDQVTGINQDSQLKMNDINSETKQKDRNFDLANTALSKMYDNLQKILGAS